MTKLVTNDGIRMGGGLEDEKMVSEDLLEAFMALGMSAEPEALQQTTEVLADVKRDLADAYPRDRDRSPSILIAVP
jgi:hypothetical protein